MIHYFQMGDKKVSDYELYKEACYIFRWDFTIRQAMAELLLGNRELQSLPDVEVK